MARTLYIRVVYTIYIGCLYGIFGRKITSFYTVVSYGVCTEFFGRTIIEHTVIAETIHIWCIYGIFGKEVYYQIHGHTIRCIWKEITKYT